MIRVVKGREIAEVTGTRDVEKQKKLLTRRGFIWWGDEKERPRMYEGSLPNQANKSEQKPINDSGFKLPNG